MLRINVFQHLELSAESFLSFSALGFRILRVKLDRRVRGIMRTPMRTLRSDQHKNVIVTVEEQGYVPFLSS